jgi:cytochrome P450
MNTEPVDVRGYPIIGVLPTLLRDPLNYLTQTALRHEGVIRLNLGRENLYLLSQPAHFQHVLRDNCNNYEKGPSWDGVRVLFGRSMATTDDDVYWLRQRRLMQPLFTRQRLASLGQYMVEAIEDCVPSLSLAQARGTPVDLLAEAKKMSIWAIVKSMFGATITKAEVDEVDRAFDIVTRRLNTRVFATYLPSWVPLPGQAEFDRSLAAIDRIVYRMIDQRRKSLASKDDLLALLLQAYADDKAPMTDQQLRDEAVTMFVVGFETVATAAAWAMYLLAGHAASRRRVRDEVDAVLEGRPPTAETVPELTYTKMVFQEAMRLYPPGWISNRTARQDDTIAGVHIPARSNLALFIYGMHHRAAVWPDPESYDPERFTPEAAERRSTFEYLPFSAGPHQCLGNHYAMMMGPMILARMTQLFRIRLVSADAVKPQLAIVLRPQNLEAILEKA